jgi:hypothetical protein
MGADVMSRRRDYVITDEKTGPDAGATILLGESQRTECGERKPARVCDQLPIIMAALDILCAHRTAFRWGTK